VDYKEAASGNNLDVWTCLYFKVLPTDIKFRQMSEEQKMLLFVAFLETPSPEQMKMNYYKSISGPKITPVTEKEFRSIGYSSKAISKMKDELRKAGLME
jgi:hypothetical protein